MKSPLDLALYFLKFRSRSIFEIRQKLKSKNVSEEEIAKTIDVLIRNDFLDDIKFAKAFVHDRNLFKPSGNYLLKMELKQLGVDENIIEDCLINQNEGELAKLALESKYRYRDAEFTKQASFLQRRGFNLNIIYKITNKKID